jgi:hypothetical protein
MKKDPIYMGEWGWSWLGFCSHVSVICPDFHQKYINYHVMARTSCPLGKLDWHSHHPLKVCMKEDPIYMGEWGWSLLGCCSLCFCYLSRFSLKLYKLQCNGQNFPPIGQVRDTFTPSFESIYEGSSYKHGINYNVMATTSCPLGK